MTIRSKLAYLLAATAMLTGLMHDLASASDTGATNLVVRGIMPATESQLIDEFVNRVHDKWDASIERDDYRVIRELNSVLVVPKGVEPLHVQSNGVDMFQISGAVNPPAGEVTTKEDAVWNRPVCLARHNLANPVFPSVIEAWADACYAAGYIQYPGQSGWDAVFKQYQTCATTGNGLNYHLKQCTMAFGPVGNGGGINFLDWNDWSPKSTTYMNPCSQLNLAVSVAGFGAEHAISLCETLNPVKGERPLDFQANWAGDAPTKHHRETGDLISVHNALLSGIPYQVYYGGMEIGF
ncbi:hypothetical protein ABZ345_16940 [Lentzea sp. NPDC005914]|uniref:hypothetical protein n=1 Tax=Lentzea sp. NPDC005914 TaxID=3154572 RepID=UPI00340F1FD5